jgi:hypothetical protein
MSSKNQTPSAPTNAIGWDIGIKNLAYCSLEQQLISLQSVTPVQVISNVFVFNNHSYVIKNWADISLLSQITANLAGAGQVTSLAGNQSLACCAAKTDKLNSPLCGLLASYCDSNLAVNGTYRGYCKKHYKKLGSPKMPSVIVTKCFFTDSSSAAGCTSKAIQVLKNHIYMGYCKKHGTDMIKSGSKVEGDFLKINRVKNAGKIDLNHLGIALFQELDKIKNHVLEPNVVLLENQPVLKNPTMKSMQMFLYSYYLMRTMEDNQSTGLGHKHLQCYTASKKLDLIKFFPKSEQDRISGLLDKVKNNYQRNKKMSIYMVEYLLNKTPGLLEFFNKHHKQDDLADSLLMTLHYFERAELVKLKKSQGDDKKCAKVIGNKQGKKGGKKETNLDDENEDEDIETNEEVALDLD